MIKSHSFAVVVCFILLSACGADDKDKATDTAKNQKTNSTETNSTETKISGSGGEYKYKNLNDLKIVGHNNHICADDIANLKIIGSHNTVKAKKRLSVIA